MARRPVIRIPRPCLAGMLAAVAVAVLSVAAAGPAGHGRAILQGPDSMPPPKLSTGGTSMALDDFSDLTACQATASTSFTLIGSGSGSASASSSCEAKVNSTGAATRAVADFLNGTLADHPKYCGEEMIVAVAAAVGQAVASAYASAAITLEVTGSGTACADASAEADAYAVSMAKAVLRDAVETPREEGSKVMRPGNNALCLSASLSVVFARAWAQAKVSGCQDGPGVLEDRQASISRSVQRAVARVLVEVARKSCPRNNRLRLDAAEASLAEGLNFAVNADADRVAVEEFASGMAQASGGTLQQCDGEIEAQCCGGDASGCGGELRAGLTVKETGGEKCCCLAGLLPYYEQ